jgi:hypothetical protein
LSCQSNVTEGQDNIVYRTYLLIIMTRQEMQKLLDELECKDVETRDKEVKKEPCDELARKLEKLKKESLN